MKKEYKIKKGLDLKLAGEAPKVLRNEPVAATEYAVKPADFYGVKPKLLVKEGAKVLAGDALFLDKATEKIKFVSPVSGVVSSIERGERRKLLRIRIQADEKTSYKEIQKIDMSQAGKDEILSFLLENGLFAFFRQRPYDIIASPHDDPRDIFVSAFNKMPLAADFSFAAQGQEDYFKAGIEALSKLAKVHVGISKEQVSEKWTDLPFAEVNVFDGPNPAGNVGVQINHVAPVNKGEVVWTMGAEAVIFVGRALLEGRVDLTRTLAIGGSEITKPCYCKAAIGIPLASLLEGLLQRSEHVRIVNGNAFVGEKSGLDDFLSAFSTEICALPEGDDVHEIFGWIAPRLNDFSTSRSYFSWLFKNKSYKLDCRIKGGRRNMIMSSEYERVFPMDIYPGYLIKAIITGDIDKQEALGIYEVAPEDFAVAEFVDSSKLELQRIAREGLDVLRKENA